MPLLLDHRDPTCWTVLCRRTALCPNRHRGRHGTLIMRLTGAVSQMLFRILDYLIGIGCIRLDRHNLRRFLCDDRPPHKMGLNRDAKHTFRYFFNGPIVVLAMSVMGHFRTSAGRARKVRFQRQCGRGGVDRGMSGAAKRGSRLLSRNRRCPPGRARPGPLAPTPARRGPEDRSCTLGAKRRRVRGAS